MIKVTELTPQAMEFYRLCPPPNRPATINQIDLSSYEYSRTPGRFCTLTSDWEDVHSLCCRALWGGVLCEDPTEFCKKYDVPLISMVKPVRIVHGRLFASHIIMPGVFLSPGKPELLCQEYDEAGMLMSLITLWETATRHWTPCNAKIPFVVTKNHWILLYCHWKRQISTEYGEYVMAKIAKGWDHDPYKFRQELVNECTEAV